MNSTHLHLVINHLAIIGSLLGSLVLIYAILVRSTETQIAAYGLFIIAAIGAVITFQTGETAEEAVEHLSGVSESIIERHEDSANLALAGLLTLGLASLSALYLTMKKSQWMVAASRITLILAIVSFVLIARTGYLGGQIRHTEITNASATGQSAGSHEQDESDDD
ncbi:MAG TPA: hypothetical protein VFT90_00665 [Chryseosolibacter sp.]|nr:hypothetical protein [Chryseosolibacter sp.]